MKNFENYCRAKMVKTKHNAVRRQSAPLDAKLGELIETNISNSRARFRCV